MLDEKLQLKIELLQDQITNLEKSGHYTESEIQVKTKPLKIELDLIKDSLSYEFLTLQELRQLYTRVQNAIKTKNTTGTGFVTKVSGVLTSLKKDVEDYITTNKYGMSDEEYKSAKANYNSIFAPIKAMNIEVIDAEILTPNHQEA